MGGNYGGIQLTAEKDPGGRDYQKRRRAEGGQLPEPPDRCLLHQQAGEEFYELFKDRPINKILTIEASGIGIACLTAIHFRVPVLFAKKSAGSNMDREVYSTEIKSFTHNKVNHVVVSKKYLNAGDHVLIIDDFLANGCAVEGLIDLVHQAGAEVEGVGIAIEKGFQGGGDALRKKGYDVKSLAIIEKMDAETGTIVFR
jgi:xanthine phosphoribosyltransferase